MSFEKPGTSDDDKKIEEALARLRQRLDERDEKKQPYKYESETGFGVTVFPYEEGLLNLYLREGGHESTFSVQGNELRFTELRGPDDEHVTRPNIVARHKAEAERLLKAGELTPEKTIKDQLDLDL